MTMLLAVPDGVVQDASFVLRVDGAARRIVVGGELDVATAPLLVESATVAINALGAVDIDLDLSDVDFICAAGLGAVAVLTSYVARAGHRLSIVGVSAYTRRVFVLGGLGDLLDPADG